MKIFGVLLALFCFVIPTWAADVKVSELPEATAVTSDDLLLVIDAPGGAIASQKVTVSNFFCAGTAIEQGDIFYYNGTNIKCLPHGTAGQPLISGGNAANPSWLDTVLATGANTFSITKGTASLDVAAAATVNIDTSLTVQTGAVTLTGNAAGSTLVLPSGSLTLPAAVIGGTYGATANTIGKRGADATTVAASGITEDGTTVQLTALNLATTGTITGGIKVEKDDNSLAAAQCYGTFHWYSGGAETTTLPAAVVGMNLCVYASDATVKHIDPNGTDTIVLNGVALAAGYQIESPGAVGNFICLVSFTANQWTTLGQSGVWITHGAD